MAKQVERSAAFKAMRMQHSLELAEDYCELISELITKHEEARTGVIAEHLGISHVTASRTLSRLKEEGFVNTENRKPITLTAKGARLAAKAKRRHELLLRFFIEIGVSQKQAEIDVEGAEHHISAETLSCIERMLASESRKK